MISTAIAAAIPRIAGAVSARTSQPRKVMTAMTITVGTNTALIRSASRWIGGRELCASRTIAMMRASTLAAPTVVAR